MKIFDLNSYPKFTKNLQKNIVILKKMYGNSFIIKNGSITLPSKLTRQTEKHNPKLKFYSLKYDIKNRDTWLFPYKISFIDMDIRNKTRLNNNCYISNINKTDLISGSNMVLTVIKLLKILHAEKVILHDGANVKCEQGGQDIDLSLFKLLEKGITFYQKFGFKFSMDYGSIHHTIDFGSTKNMINALHNALRNINKIKLKYYKDAYLQILDIIHKVIKNQDYDKVKIYLYHPYEPYIIKNNKEQLLEMVKDIDDLLNIIKSSNSEYLIETMIKLMYSDCSQYIKLENLIFNNMIHKIIYKKNSIELKHIDIFRTLSYIRYSAMFELTLD